MQQNTICIEQQKRQQTLKRFGVATGAVGATMAATQANALDVSNALSGNDAESNIETAATWVLGIAVVIFAARKVIGFFSR